MARVARERVLVIDDDEQILKAIALFLRHEGMDATCRPTGAQGLSAAEGEGPFDLMLLDLDLPDMDGFSVLERLRSRGDVTPVIIISGHDEEYNKLIGLGGGADDYVTKPFSLPLLISKARALIRRNSLYAPGGHTGADAGDRLVYGLFVLERDACRVCKDGRPLALTAREFALLTLFMSHPGQVFSKAQLYERVWDSPVVDENTVMVYVKRLRDKIEDDPAHPAYLQTLRGLGYRLGA